MIAVSYGGGVNSTAMLIAFVERGIKPDVIMFANTGCEREETYRHVREMSSWCEAHGLPAIQWIDRGYERHKDIEDECLNLKTLPSLAFGFRGCSVKWKRQPMDRHLRKMDSVKALWASGGKVTRAIGIDAGEAHRGKIPDDDHFHYWFPLIEWGMDREACVAAIKGAGLEPPPKSACWMCPAMKKKEVIQLAIERPDLFKRAVNIERVARASGKLEHVDGLGRHWSWEELVKADPEARKVFVETIPQDCLCFDGEADADEQPKEQKGPSEQPEPEKGPA